MTLYLPRFSEHIPAPSQYAAACSNTREPFTSRSIPFRKVYLQSLIDGAKSRSQEIRPQPGRVAGIDPIRFARRAAHSDEAQQSRLGASRSHYGLAELS